MTDAERAHDFRDRLVKAYAPVAAIMDEAVAAGFMINMNAGPGPNGKIAVTDIKLFKAL